MTLTFFNLLLFLFSDPFFWLKRLRPGIVFVWICGLKWIERFGKVLLFRLLIRVEVGLTQFALRCVFYLVSAVDLINVAHNCILDVTFEPLTQLIL
jgi:hypothetical protein